MKRYLALFVFTISTSGALAGWQSGNDLLEKCSDTQYQFFNQGYCMGYVISVADAGDRIIFCTPKGANANQLVAITQRYLKDRPENRHLNAATLVVDALRQAFPCPSK